MTPTSRIYLYIYLFMIDVVIKAQQPDGYLGCFKDNDGDSLNNGTKKYSDIRNTGKRCKAECREHSYRYAGTVVRVCYCGSDIVRKWQRNEAECNRNCENNPSEKCGGYFAGDWRISLYETLPSNSTIKTKENVTIHPSTQATRSSNLQTEQSVSAITTTVHFIISPSTQNTESSTLPNQTSVNLLAIYIAIPVTIIVSIVSGLIICVILRKNRSKKNEERNATNHPSSNTSQSLLAKDNNVCNERDKTPAENSTNVIHIERKKEKATVDRDIIPLENSAHIVHIESSNKNVTVDESDNNYNTIAQWRELNMHKDISVDANEYGHLNVRPTAFHDPTYSHTTGFQDSNDCTYSHMNQSATQLSHLDHVTYSTCKLTRETRKHRSAMKNEDIDDTYNTLGINGKAQTLPEKKKLCQRFE